MLQNYLKTSGPFDLILGDFNLPHIDWQTQTSSTHTGETYVELFQDLFLHQHVVEPTHVRGNVLDLVFTQDESFIHDIRCLKEESISDHYPLLIELDMLKKNHVAFNATSDPNELLGSKILPNLEELELVGIALAKAGQSKCCKVRIS